MTDKKQPHDMVIDMAERLAARLKLYVTHAANDVVFVQHNFFCFLEPEGYDGEKKIDISFNRETPPDIASRLTLLLKEEADAQEIELVLRGSYELEQTGEDSMRMEFFPEEDFKAVDRLGPDQ